MEYIETILIYLLEYTPKSFAEIPFIKALEYEICCVDFTSCITERSLM